MFLGPVVTPEVHGGAVYFKGSELSRARRQVLAKFGARENGRHGSVVLFCFSFGYVSK